ncbi:hypothetical protein DL95DRAFT_383695 [Leptodontidium sp. 2 PMI_412]|nr:hypothetical protein DL95DRAFT_383695 [Leptodontidium sp. 2 PMI_412]
MLIKIELTKEIPIQANVGFESCKCSSHYKFAHPTTKAAKTRPTSESSVTRHPSNSNSRKSHGPASRCRLSESSNDADHEDSIKGSNKTRRLPANSTPTHPVPTPILNRYFA